MTNALGAPSRRLTTVLALLGLLLTSVPGAARADEGDGGDGRDGAAGANPETPVVQQARFTTSDGVELQTTLTRTGPVAARPTVVEFSPYGRDSGSLDVSADYNFLLVQIRGTGDSDGSFDALGPATQRDVVEVLDWACDQPFSDGRLALSGFSASAITLYNSWHQELPCVEAAIMKSGTHELYRDLLVPGGVLNLLPGAGVLALIGAPALLQGPERLQRDPASSLDILGGLFATGLNVLGHPTLDDWWRERGWRGDANDIPVLMINGFFDVESRGAFEAYRALKADGAHLVMEGGHDGVPVGTDGGAAEARAWLDHYVRGIDNGIEDTPRVSLTLAAGDRYDYLDGDNVTVTGDDWPLPGTTWAELALTRDRSLSPQRDAATSHAAYLSVPSIPTMTDIPNVALLEASGLRALTGSLPLLTQSALAGLGGLTGVGYTSPVLEQDVDLVGPLALELDLATTTPGSGLWAVLSDVAPDGTSHPMTVGRLSTTYPGVIAERSLVVDGKVVQPYGDYTHPSPATIGQFRRYQVELWPVGNRFRAGHRVRLQVVGTSLASPLALPALHVIRTGGPGSAVLRVPVAPGEELAFR